MPHEKTQNLDAIGSLNRRVFDCNPPPHGCIASQFVTSDFGVSPNRSVSLISARRQVAVARITTTGGLWDAGEVACQTVRLELIDLAP